MRHRFLRISLAPGPSPAGWAPAVCAVDLDLARPAPSPVLRIWRAGPSEGAPGVDVTLAESPDGVHWTELPGDAGRGPETGGATSFP